MTVGRGWLPPTVGYSSPAAWARSGRARRSRCHRNTSLWMVGSTSIGRARMAKKGGGRWRIEDRNLMGNHGPSRSYAACISCGGRTESTRSGECERDGWLGRARGGVGSEAPPMGGSQRVGPAPHGAEARDAVAHRSSQGLWSPIAAAAAALVHPPRQLSVRDRQRQRAGRIMLESAGVFQG